MKKLFRRKDLSAQGLYRAVRTAFDEIAEPRQPRRIALSDVLMSGLAMFSLKYPSLLQFDRARNETTVRPNLRTLFGVQQAPCDTTMRERLDDVGPQGFEKVYKRRFALLQRGKGLEGFEVLDGRYVLSVDGTGAFRPGKCIAGTVARNPIEMARSPITTSCWERCWFIPNAGR